MVLNTKEFPEGTLAYREYEVELDDGSKANIAITLGDPDADTAAGKFAREHNARAYGLISIMEIADTPERPIVWVVDDTDLSLAVEADEPPLSDEVEEIVNSFLGLFFIQVSPIAPQLNGMRIAREGHEPTVH